MLDSPLPSVIMALSPGEVNYMSDSPLVGLQCNYVSLTC